MTLATLIARLEAATGPDPGMDCEIWAAIGGTLEGVTEVGGHVHWRWIDKDGVRWSKDLTNFTASLDAALRLVPELHNWRIFSDLDEGMFTSECEPQAQYHTTPRYAKTPALALCIAALKARATA